MLGVRSYPREYVNACRDKVASDVANFRRLATAGNDPSAVDGTPVTAAVATLESTFYNNMLLVLDYLFVHRLRTVDGKDSNALNEVRVMCNSIMLYSGVMTADKSIKLAPATTILKCQFGDRITLHESTFSRLADAFFAEIERKFV